MEKLTVAETSEYSHRVQDHLKTNKWSRAGQALFNVLYDMRPDLADSIRATQYDPFYRNDIIKEFLPQVISKEGLTIINPKLLK